MAEELMKIECDPMYGFMVKSHNEKELVDVVKEHIKRIHKGKPNEKEIREMIKPA